ncbi:MAG: hypothetical protein JWR21_926 [Herminiimonas sp.]|nr:hypothetical protein [Herminiimonas sp.]
MKPLTLTALMQISLAPITSTLRRWYFRRLEQHYLMSAVHEQKRAKEANENAAYFQKRAAWARSDSIR